MVAAASCEARVFGVRSVMSSVPALRQCAELNFVPPRFEVYGAVSHQIHAIFAEYPPYPNTYPRAMLSRAACTRPRKFC